MLLSDLITKNTQTINVGRVIANVAGRALVHVNDKLEYFDTTKINEVPEVGQLVSFTKVNGQKIITSAYKNSAVTIQKVSIDG